MVIDVSYAQGKIQWEKVKPYIDGAILRCGYGDNITSQDDSTYLYNVSECERLGIPYGVYLYSYADSRAHAISETEHILRLISGRKLSYPVYIDLEDYSVRGSFNPEWYIEMGEKIEAAGFWFGVYANKYWFTNVIGSSLDRFTKWVAQYNDTCTYRGTYDMWQYTSGGTVPGICGNVDCNTCYKDFPSLISGNNHNDKPADNINIVKTRDYVNMRVNPYVGSSTLTTIPPGQTLNVMDDDGYGWIQVPYAGKVGWICGLYVDGTTSKCKHITCQGNNVNVRSGAGTGYPVLFQMFSGDYITLISQYNGWGYIKYNDTYGYIYLDWSYLTIVD